MKFGDANTILSVLMTSYNRESLISESIQSVLSSSYSDFEFIIVDDASTDSTWHIIKELASIDIRIKAYRNDSNLGDYVNRNKAASYASGDYIMFLDSDDILYTDSIEKCMAIMEANPDCNFGISCSKLNKLPYSKLSSKDAINMHFFITPILMSGPGGTVQKFKYFRELGFYPIKYGPANDMYHNLKAACYTNIILFPYDISYYRIHDSQESNDKYSYLYNYYNVLKDSLVELPLHLNTDQINWVSKKNKRRFVRNLTKIFLKQFDFYRISFAIQKTKFKLCDFINGVFHLN
jgi:glycosyltransferase involved in cell wall biosynthesis